MDESICPAKNFLKFMIKIPMVKRGVFLRIKSI